MKKLLSVILVVVFMAMACGSAWATPAPNPEKAFQTKAEMYEFLSLPSVEKYDQVRSDLDHIYSSDLVSFMDRMYTEGFVEISCALDVPFREECGVHKGWKGRYWYLYRFDSPEESTIYTKNLLVQAYFLDTEDIACLEQEGLQTFLTEKGEPLGVYLSMGTSREVKIVTEDGTERAAYIHLRPDKRFLVYFRYENYFILVVGPTQITDSNSVDYQAIVSALSFKEIKSSYAGPLDQSGWPVKEEIPSTTPPSDSDTATDAVSSETATLTDVAPTGGTVDAPSTDGNAPDAPLTDGTDAAPTSTDTPTDPAPFPWLWVIVPAGVVLIAAATVALAIRKKKKPSQEK